MVFDILLSSAGHWSGCTSQSDSSKTICGASGRETRPVTCTRLAVGAPVDDRYCLQQSPPPPASRDCFRVCPHHRHAYRWKIGEWTECRATGTCRYGLQPGVRRRNITCVTVCDADGDDRPLKMQLPQQQRNGRTMSTVRQSTDDAEFRVVHRSGKEPSNRHLPKKNKVYTLAVNLACRQSSFLANQHVQKFNSANNVLMEHTDV